MMMKSDQWGTWMSTGGRLMVGRTSGGYLLRVEGQGTMRESQAVHAFAVDSLQIAQSTFTIDLSQCEYLDSTFLGCLFDIYRMFGQQTPARFRIFAPTPACRKMMAGVRLDAVVPIIDELPEAPVEFAPLETSASFDDGMAEHVMHCHQQLGEHAGEAGEVFLSIAERMARELGEGKRGR